MLGAKFVVGSMVRADAVDRFIEIEFRVRANVEAKNNAARTEAAVPPPRKAGPRGGRIKDAVERACSMQGRLLEAEECLRPPSGRAAWGKRYRTFARRYEPSSRIRRASNERKRKNCGVAKELAAEQQRRAEEHAALRLRESTERRDCSDGDIGCRACDGRLGNYRREKGGRRRREENALQAQQHAENARMRATVRQLAGQAWQKQDELDAALLLALEYQDTRRKSQRHAK